MKKKQGHSPVELIIHKRRWIEKIFAILFVFSLLCIPFVGVNYDLTEYLPDDAPTSRAIDIMEQDFTYPGNGRVMLQDVTLYEAKAIKDRIADVDGVDMILWCDSEANIYGSSEFIDYDDIEDYYKDGDAYMDITFLERDSSDRTHKAVQEIRKIIDGRGVMAGSAASDTDLGPTLTTEISHVMILAVIVIFLILTLTTTSWFEPLLFLMIMGIAIVIGMGTNLLFGEISFMANSIGAVLQLACSMDYSIFLLHAFTREKDSGVEAEQAMANALRTAVTSIGASGATTIVGFLALALMRFTIGKDIGFVFAKGIVCSLCTVLLLMPSFILRFQSLIERTAHRPFLPGFRKLGEFAYRIRIPLTVVVLLLVVPCYVGQGMADFTYGNEALTNSPGMEVYENEQLMNEKFGRSNTMLVLVPVGDNVTEKAMTEELDDLPYVRQCLGLASELPAGIPENFLPGSITEQLHSGRWSRVIVNVRSAGESEAAFQYTDEIRDIVQKYYPGKETYVVGVTPATQDIRDIIRVDYSSVNIISLLGVALVVAITYKSPFLPLVVLIPIESAVFINTALPYIYGQRAMFLGFIVVSCIQLGATIDYSILMTGNYLDARTRCSKKDAAIHTVEQSALSILTSGFILAVAGYGMYFLTSVDAIGSLGRLIGRGALFSMALVLFMLPACLMAFDRFIIRPDHEQKKNARLAKIHGKRLTFPVLSELQKQHQALHEQMRRNHQARRKAFMDRLQKLGSHKDSKNTENTQNPEESEEQNDEKK